MAEKKVIDFYELNFDEKKKLVISGLLKAYNFNNLSATVLDWSSSLPGLCVPVYMVLTVLQTLNFNRICNELKGQKTAKEMFLIVFDC